VGKPYTLLFTLARLPRALESIMNVSSDFHMTQAAVQHAVLLVRLKK
jgi:hypothetical protein